MWLTLAAEHYPPGAQRDNSIDSRKSITGIFSMTQEQISEGDRLAKEWRPGRLPVQSPEVSGRLR